MLFNAQFPPSALHEEISLKTHGFSFAEQNMKIVIDITVNFCKKKNKKLLSILIFSCYESPLSTTYDLIFVYLAFLSWTIAETATN